MSGSTLLLTAFVVGTAMYFVPLIIAIIRKKSNVVAIGALNVFLGWTLVGWVVSLVWALSNAQPQTVIVQNLIAAPPEQRS